MFSSAGGGEWPRLRMLRRVPAATPIVCARPCLSLRVSRASCCLLRVRRPSSVQLLRWAVVPERLVRPCGAQTGEFAHCPALTLPRATPLPDRSQARRSHARAVDGAASCAAVIHVVHRGGAFSDTGRWCRRLLADCNGSGGCVRCQRRDPLLVQQGESQDGDRAHGRQSRGTPGAEHRGGRQSERPRGLECAPCEACCRAGLRLLRCAALRTSDRAARRIWVCVRGPSSMHGGWCGGDER